MLPSDAGAGGPWGAAGEAADQAKALGQSRRAGRLLLQQLEACLHHLGLTETEGLAQAVEPGLAAVIQAHGNRPHLTGCNTAKIQGTRWGSPARLSRRGVTRHRWGSSTALAPATTTRGCGGLLGVA